MTAGDPEYEAFLRWRAEQQAAAEPAQEQQDPEPEPGPGAGGDQDPAPGQDPQPEPVHEPEPEPGGVLSDHLVPSARQYLPAPAEPAADSHPVGAHPGLGAGVSN